MSLNNPFYCMVIEATVRPTKIPQRFFWQMTIRTDTAGEIKANMWDAPANCEGNPVFPQLGDILEVTEFKDQLKTHQSVVLVPGGFVRIEKDKIPEKSKHVCDVPKATPQQMKEAMAILFDKEMWKDVKHLGFVQNCLKCLDKEKLKVSPAATHIHHAFQGGLLVHTAEVVKFCRAIVDAMPQYDFIDKDVLYASAILHDIGKVETYSINKIGTAESAWQEKAIGHMHYGMYLVQRVAEEIDVDQSFVDEVLHCIAAHHGLLEWGSYKEVQSHEAAILSRVDYISSRCGMLAKKLDEYKVSNQHLEEEFKIYGDRYFASRGIRNYVQG